MEHDAMPNMHFLIKNIDSTCIAKLPHTQVFETETLSFVKTKSLGAATNTDIDLTRSPVTKFCLKFTVSLATHDHDDYK